MMKQIEKTMKRDEKQGKNNENWRKTMKHDEKERKNNEQ